MSAVSIRPSTSSRWRTDLPIQAVADYKSIIWDGYAGYNVRAGISLLPDLVRFVPSDPSLGGGQASGKVSPDIIALYMAAGGHVLLCGEQPMTAVINQGILGSPGFPVIFRYELTGDQKSPYDDSDIGRAGWATTRSRTTNAV